MKFNSQSFIRCSAHQVDYHINGGEFTAKCPKCGKEVAPKKTWKMAGRPDKTGKRTELTVGLSECCGKTFRTILSKQKI
jgi:hypothetical protein